MSKVRQAESQYSFLDRTINYLSPQWGAQRQVARLRLSAASQFRGAETSRLRSDWLTVSPVGTTPLKWELDRLRERSRDLNRSDPVASGATDTMALNIVGQGLQPQSRLRAEALGISEPQAQELRRRVEDIFDLWSPQADAANRLDFNEIQFLALRKIVEDGETILIPAWVQEPWRFLGRALELVESDRLATPFGKSGIFQGVELGPARREPVRYWLRRADIAKTDYEYQSTEFVGIPARDAKGRPMVLHLFPTKRPGQVRGVPFFAPVLSYFKDLADYLEAEVVAARVAACLAVFITKTDAYAGALGGATGTETATGARLQALEPGIIPYLNIGEDIRVVDPKRGGETFNSFVEGLLRIIGASLGLPYELLVKDFSKTNYSSARAALLEGRRQFISWRSWLARKLCQPVWEMVLEEAWLRGFFQVKDFYAKKSEICRAQWIGGAWGWVDPVKEVISSKMAVDWGFSTQADETAGQGRDWEETLEQRAREKARAKELGLVIPEIEPKAAGASSAPESQPAGQTIFDHALAMSLKD